MPVTAAKSYMGNLGAAGGMVELIASVLALRHDKLFPILNYETPDPRCPIHAVRSCDAARRGQLLEGQRHAARSGQCVVIRRASLAILSIVAHVGRRPVRIRCFAATRLSERARIRQLDTLAGDLYSF